MFYCNEVRFQIVIPTFHFVTNFFMSALLKNSENATAQIIHVRDVSMRLMMVTNEYTVEIGLELEFIVYDLNICSLLLCIVMIPKYNPLYLII